MSFSRYNASMTSQTKLRTPHDYAPASGMCTVCTDDCPGPCEIGRSAVNGPETLYPPQRATSQAASEKDYPIDFSHFNINGRCYGSFGSDNGQTGYTAADLATTVGNKQDPIKLKAPYVFPAIAKLDWRGYYTGAALAGVIAVIGEDMATTDPDAVIKQGRVVQLPQMKERLDAFYRYNEGYGALFLQANTDDERLGLLDYAIEELGLEAAELKIGQGAKGVQMMNQLPSLEKALSMKEMGYDVYPDPEDPEVSAAYQRGQGAPFYKVGQNPEWEPESFARRVETLRKKGARYISVKIGPYRPADIARTLLIASQAGVDMVTLDGAGGGTGNSPLRMMNEWGYPTVYLETVVRQVCEKMAEKGMHLPAVVMAGGFAFEDQVFKGLAMGAPHVKLIGLGRAPMAAAMVAETLAKSGDVNFSCLNELKGRFGEEALKLPPGGIGAYNYVQRVSTGVQQLMSLCRKFSLESIDREDIVALTREAADVTGIVHASDLDLVALEELFR